MALMQWLRAQPLKSNFLSVNSFSVTLGELFNCCELRFPHMQKGDIVAVVMIKYRQRERIHFIIDLIKINSKIFYLYDSCKYSLFWVCLCLYRAEEAIGYLSINHEPSSISLFIHSFSIIWEPQSQVSDGGVGIQENTTWTLKALGAGREGRFAGHIQSDPVSCPPQRSLLSLPDELRLSRHRLPRHPVLCNEIMVLILFVQCLSLPT